MSNPTSAPLETDRCSQAAWDFAHTIDGTPRHSAHTFPVINPSTGATYMKCPDASRDQVDEAVAAAGAAYRLWRQIGVSDRRAYLDQFAKALELHHEAISEVLTSEQGKPLGQVRRFP